MKKNFIIICLVVCLLGCSNTVTDGVNDREIFVFRGQYLSNNQSGNIGTRKTDSLVFTILNNSSYSIRFYDKTDNDIDFCSHSGFVENFWTNSVILIIDNFEYGNCDSLSLPRNSFVGDFTTHGDTVVLEQIKGDTLRRIRMLR